MYKEWRLIESGPCGAAYNMALDESIACFVRKGSPPCLRIYGWKWKSLSLGCFQRTADIDTGYCAEKGISIVRRPSGGRAVLHCDELTYSLSAAGDCEPFSKGLLESYRKISEAFALAFRAIGINIETKKRREKGSVLAGSPLCFQSSSYAEILVSGRKVMGSAQKRWADGLLQQGSIPYSLSVDEMRRIVRAGKNAGADSGMAGLREFVPGLNEPEFKSILARSFEQTFGIRFIRCLPEQEELALAEELQERKYLLPSWNFHR
jgi:lipoyl(octanoyl) transferase